MQSKTLQTSIFASLLIIAIALLPSISQAGVLNLGLVSYDQLIPSAPGLPGVDVFSINNFTGNPATGGFAIPPQFASLSAVTFTNSSLSVVIGGSSQNFPLGNITAGSFTPTALRFPDTTSISAATFSATLGQTSFLLSGGGTFQTGSPQISITLKPSSGSFLVAGTDAGVISVSNIPEPATWLLVAIAAPVMFACRRLKTSRYL